MILHIHDAAENAEIAERNKMEENLCVLSALCGESMGTEL